MYANVVCHLILPIVISHSAWHLCWIACYSLAWFQTSLQLAWKAKLRSKCCVHFLFCVQVFALDTVQERLDLAKEFGAVPINGADRENALKVIKEGTEGRGVDCALEAVGAQPTIKLAFDIIRMGGRAAALHCAVPRCAVLCCAVQWIQSLSSGYSGLFNSSG